MKTDRSVSFHAVVPNDPKVAGFVMVEQVKSIDYRMRKVRRIGTASDAVLEEVLSILDACNLYHLSKQAMRQIGFLPHGFSVNRLVTAASGDCMSDFFDSRY